MPRLRALFGTVLPLAFSLLLTSCAYVEYEDVNLYPKPSAGKAMVYFYREPAFFGGYIGYPVGIGDGDDEIGALSPGTYFFAEFDPGEYIFWVETDKRDEVMVTLRPGATVYLSSQADLGLFAPLVLINEVSARKGEKAVRSLRYALATDP